MTTKDKEIAYLNEHKEVILAAWRAGVTAKALSQEHSVMSSTIKKTVKGWIEEEEKAAASAEPAADNETLPEDHETLPEDHGSEAPDHETLPEDHGSEAPDHETLPEIDPKDEAYRKSVTEASLVFEEDIAAARAIYEQGMADIHQEAEGKRKKVSDAYDKAYSEAYKKYMKAIGSNP